MNWIIKMKLKKLFATNVTNESINTCYKFIIRCGFVKFKTAKVAIEEVREIYQRRAELAKDCGTAIAGCSELLKNLSEETGAKVRIYGFEVGEMYYTVFTNVAIDKIVGVLVSKDINRDRVGFPI